jgi:hypothetical protein
VPSDNTPRDKRSAPLLDAERIDADARAGGRSRDAPLVTYTVVTAEVAPADRRRQSRRRTHLQSAKILDEEDRFLVDCRLQNKAASGARLHLAKPVMLPRRIQIYADQAEELRDAEVMWRRGLEVGCKLAAQPTLDKPQLSARLKSRYYAL